MEKHFLIIIIKPACHSIMERKCLRSELPRQPEKYHLFATKEARKFIMCEINCH